MDTKTRFIGNCQLCERDQKLDNGLMVHHGYQRPGVGYIFGDCPGVHVVPYEVSCDAIKAWKVQLEAELVGQKARLAKLLNGEVTSFIEMEYAGPRQDKVMVTYEFATTPKYKWESLLRSRIWEAERQVGATETTIARCEARITAWEPKPIRTFEEEMAKVQADKAARAVVVAEKRAAKQAKIDATKAKQDALKAKRQAIKDDFIAKFKALAESPESIVETKKAAIVLANELTKAKYRFLYVHELGLDDVFIKLGLAERENSRWVKYSFYLMR